MHCPLTFNEPLNSCYSISLQRSPTLILQRIQTSTMHFDCYSSLVGMICENTILAVIEVRLYQYCKQLWNFYCQHNWPESTAGPHQLIAARKLNLLNQIKRKKERKNTTRRQCGQVVRNLDTSGSNSVLTTSWICFGYIANWPASCQLGFFFSTESFPIALLTLLTMRYLNYLH